VGPLVRVTNPEAALFRRVDEEESAERPESLTTQPRLRFLLQKDYPTTGISELGSGHQASEPGADHDDISGVSDYSYHKVHCRQLDWNRR
jgi:hypothetical protein